MFSKKIIFIALFSLFGLLAQAKLEFNAQYPLYTADGARYGFDQIHAALDTAFASNKPVVIYIHGRGDEPLKSIEGKPLIGGATVPKIEKDFDVRVILFNWDSQGLLLDRKKPLSNIPAAVESFKKVLAAIKTYNLTNKKLILHAHSMGSIVIQTYILQNGWPAAGSPIFSNVLFTEPDADNLKHAVWMDQISSQENVFITINNDDVILNRSTDARPPGAAALGLKPTADLSYAATYLDFTKLGDKVNKATHVHEIFDKDGMKFQVHICTVIEQIMKGENPTLFSMYSNPIKTNYLKFRFDIDKSDICFK
ncbi:MAG: alpha/beta hydrolase [Bdellovibrionaceae bacterium]|nr:alpha/beta hydrolase [Pseudobdellovibrionaceae bacterium]